MPFVELGIERMLNAQRTYLNGLEWRLYPDDTTISISTVIGDLGLEAAWAGYAAQAAVSWGTVYFVNPRAISQNTTLPVFGNTSGMTQDFFVVGLVDPADDTLVWALNLGLQSIPDGEIYTLAPGISDKQE